MQQHPHGGPAAPTAGRALRRPEPRPAAALRLVCLPHAGGSHSLYQEWAALLPPEVELIAACPPGRLDRIDDPWPAGIPELAAGFADALAPWLDRPWAVFGHSMGALTGFELALRVRRLGLPAPVRLFASACPAPQFFGGRSGRGPRTDEELCAELKELGGIDPALLDLPELRELVLPVVRGDYELLDRYRPEPGSLLPCPVGVLTGREDTGVSAAAAEGWAAWTAGPSEVTTFPGGHFYLDGQADRVLAQVLRGLPLPHPA
ncbi:thioesterase domain-containing protein [Streptomyces sp. NPDC097619]|uniref:thioesterase II family protein n=1 Tax=Streptomyces sp. NPDC097619 TaxID=3157228 RepID=UPI00331A6AD8